MDNKVITIKHKGRKAFNLAFQIFFADEYESFHKHEKTVTHYFEHPEKGLVFLWHEDTSVNSVKLPVPLNWEGAAQLAWTWLLAQPEKSYQEYCDHDGSNSHGFKVYNEAWGHVISHYAVVAVCPIWAWHGK